MQQHRFEARLERDGLKITFRGWCYPLQNYFRALEDAGLVVVRLREPAPDADMIGARPDSAGWKRISQFLHRAEAGRNS